MELGWIVTFEERPRQQPRVFVALAADGPQDSQRVASVDCAFDLLPSVDGRRVEDEPQEVVSRADVVVDQAMVHAGAPGDIAQRHRRRATFGEQLAGSVDQCLRRRAASARSIAHAAIGWNSMRSDS